MRLYPTTYWILSVSVWPLKSGKTPIDYICKVKLNGWTQRVSLRHIFLLLHFLTPELIYEGTPSYLVCICSLLGCPKCFKYLKFSCVFRIVVLIYADNILSMLGRYITEMLVMKHPGEPQMYKGFVHGLSIFLIVKIVTEMGSGVGSFPLWSWEHIEGLKA